MPRACLHANTAVIGLGIKTKRTETTAALASKQVKAVAALSTKSDPDQATRIILD